MRSIISKLGGGLELRRWILFIGPVLIVGAAQDYVVIAPSQYAILKLTVIKLKFRFLVYGIRTQNRTVNSMKLSGFTLIYYSLKILLILYEILNDSILARRHRL